MIYALTFSQTLQFFQAQLNIHIYSFIIIYKIRDSTHKISTTSKMILSHNQDYISFLLIHNFCVFLGLSQITGVT